MCRVHGGRTVLLRVVLSEAWIRLLGCSSRRHSEHDEEHEESPEELHDERRLRRYKRAEDAREGVEWHARPACEAGMREGCGTFLLMLTQQKWG